MFGLMRAKKCGLSAEEKEFRRLNYCGTCKTIGALYGAKSRFLLNHDAVFLAEFLTAISGENVKTRGESFQSYNCLSIPQNDLPDALKFAATTNVILTKFKIADHITDEKKTRYNLADKAFAKEFQIAESLLESYELPLEKIEKILRTQEKIENEAADLEGFAFPTATATAEFFVHGVKTIGKNELENPARKIGFNFGKLIYLLDAFEDYERDFRARKFNALRIAFELKEDKISNRAKRKITAIFGEIETEIASEIEKLPITENQKKIFTSRLNENLRRKLKTNLPVLKTAKVCRPKRKNTFAERWKTSVRTAKIFAAKYSWQMPAVFLFILAFAMIAPAQTKDAKSARECFDLSFNLMFLGAIFGSVLAFPKPFLQKFPKRKKKNQEGGGENSGDDSGWCDWCDCDCDCCCCDCDNCGDCGGCCDCCSCDCS